MNLRLTALERATGATYDFTDDVQELALSVEGDGNHMRASATVKATPTMMRLAFGKDDNPFFISATDGHNTVLIDTFLARSGELRQPYGPLILSLIRENDYRRELGIDPLLYALDNAGRR